VIIKNHQETTAIAASATRQAIRWAYGVTTVEERLDDLLPRTLASLAAAGFNDPRLFIDGGNTVERLGLQATAHYPKVRTLGNWVLALWELYLREPRADRYAIFQDDFVTYKNLRAYLEHCEFPSSGYWNLYTFPENQQLAPPDGSVGWYLSNQKSRGATALVFNMAGVKTLLTSEHFVNRPQNHFKGWKNVDGTINSAFKEPKLRVQFDEYVHHPSLIQHTGEKSSMGNPHQELATSFRGEDFDALSLIHEKEACQVKA
jgi:hypothetical protein